MIDKSILDKYSPDSIKHIWEDYFSEFRRKGIDRPLVVIHGGYGKKNLGDDAILEMILKRIRNDIPTARFAILAHGPDEVKKMYNVEAYHFASYGAFISIIRANVYVIGGGGIVNIINVYSGFQKFRIFDMKGKFLFLAAALAKMCRAKVVFYTIGTTSIPDKGIKLLMKYVIKLANHVSVRDPLSKRVLENIGIKRNIDIAFDPVVKLESVSREKAISLLEEEGIDIRKRLVGICFRYVRDKRIDNKKIIVEVAKIVDWLTSEYNFDIVFFPFGRHPRKWVENDAIFAEEVGRLIKNKNHYKILKGDYLASEVKGMFGILNFCILERLHSVILCAGTETPFISIAYDNKVSEFVNMTGHSETEVKLDEFNFEKLKEKVELLLTEL